MKHKRLLVASLLPVALAACGGGSDNNDTDVAVNPPAGTPAPGTTPPPAGTAPTPTAPPIVIAVPTPVIPPVSATPATPGAPAPAQPAEGTYIRGSILQAAIQNVQFQDQQADEVVAATNAPVADGTKVLINFYRGANNSSFEMTTSPVGAEKGTAKYPFSGLVFPTTTTPEGWLALGQNINGYSYPGNTGDIKGTSFARAEGDFAIKTDDKFLIDATFAEWRGAQPGSFVQAQIGTYTLSNTVFMLCLHHSFENARRRVCALFNKDTGERKGVEAIDDSRNIGQIYYRPTTGEQPTLPPTPAPAPGATPAPGTTPPPAPTPGTPAPAPGTPAPAPGTTPPPAGTPVTGAPAVQTPPAIVASGPAQPGTTLARTEGVYTNGGRGVAGRWFRVNRTSGQEVLVGQQATYTLTTADAGSNVRYEETATNAVGQVVGRSPALTINPAPGAGQPSQPQPGTTGPGTPQPTEPQPGTTRPGPVVTPVPPPPGQADQTPPGTPRGI